MTELDNETIERAVGAVTGSAIGDALGAGYEFTNPKSDQKIAMIGGGRFNWDPGEWTDDTQMALAILDVIATGDTDIQAIAANFLAWYMADPPDIGNQTRAVLHGVEDPDDLRAAAAAYLDWNPERIGNGGLMRTAPVALAALHDRDEIAQLAEAIASLSHAHPDSVTACVLWSLAIQQAITTAQPDIPFDFEGAVRNGLDHVADDLQEKWDRLIAEAVDGPPGKFNPNGWVVTAFQAALSAIVNTPVLDTEPSVHFHDALVAAVRIGNDTDTVAAIAGGLLGGRWGNAAIPNDWKTPVHGDRRRGTEKTELAELEALARTAVIRSDA
ncbi:MAG: ADP-ribosylglycohydrolase family protein [Actinobacteria bacterium]|nr:ADP-ribosylglycohydrolase family protein [Actinomycetota bacterium]